jgi:HEAT repeat protein
MRLLAFLRKKCGISLTAVVVLLTGAAAWLGREPILAWYYVQGLSRASLKDRAIWVDRVAKLDGVAIPGLIGCLSHQDSEVCGNAQAGIADLVSRWPADDSRRAELSRLLHDRFGRMSIAGQRSALTLYGNWLESEQAHPEIAPIAVRLAMLAGRSADKEVRGASLGLIGVLLGHEEGSELWAACREAIRKSFQDPEPENRALAVNLAFRKAAGLLPQVVPLLDDPSPQVRQAAILALAGAEESVLPTDDLLRSLHDPDAEVRRLCELALVKARNLGHEDVLLARLISDARPGVRLQVLESLQRANNLEPGVWLRRLTHDPDAAVRAAAARAAGEQWQVDLSERLRQMAQSDPSLTVRQLATFYGSAAKKIEPTDSSR